MNPSFASTVTMRAQRGLSRCRCRAAAAAAGQEPEIRFAARGPIPTIWSSGRREAMAEVLAQRARSPMHVDARPRAAASIRRKRARAGGGDGSDHQWHRQRDGAENDRQDFSERLRALFGVNGGRRRAGRRNAGARRAWQPPGGAGTRRSYPRGPRRPLRPALYRRHSRNTSAIHRGHRTAIRHAKLLILQAVLNHPGCCTTIWRNSPRSSSGMRGDPAEGPADRFIPKTKRSTAPGCAPKLPPRVGDRWRGWRRASPPMPSGGLGAGRSRGRIIDVETACCLASAVAFPN